MLVRVKQGSVKFSDAVYTVGQTLELPDNEVQSVINSGAVELVVEEAPKAKVAKPREVKEEKVETKKEEIVNEPSIDWTHSELVKYAEEKGVVEPDKLGSKKNILDAILKAEEVKPE